MRKKILVLIMVLAFAAASLLMPATASAKTNACLIHNGEALNVDTSAAQAHLDHGDDPC